ncbi:unnamed protein product, partial [Prorocentrum cordatum]
EQPFWWRGRAESLCFDLALTPEKELTTGAPPMYQWWDVEKLSESDNFVGVCKPAGMFVVTDHRGLWEVSPTNFIHVSHKRFEMPSGSEPRQRGICHRLDSHTSGVQIFGKSWEAQPISAVDVHRGLPLRRPCPLRPRSLHRLAAHLMRKLAARVLRPLGSRGIHAREEMTTMAESERKRRRPAEAFSSPGSNGKLGKGDSVFVLSPTLAAARSDTTSQQRRCMQLASSSKELLHELRAAHAVRLTDASVVAAAMQKCGQRRWWDTLQEVRNFQLSSGIPSNATLCSIFLTALGKSVRGEAGFGAVAARQSEALSRGRQAWEEWLQLFDTSQDLNVGLSAALRLCVAADSPAGYAWAADLWTWARRESASLDAVSLESWALVLAHYGYDEALDLLLDSAACSSWAPSCVSLGALVNAAGERKDWRRAEEVWARLVEQFAVEPNVLCYSARAKAHLLCGRPGHSAAVLDEMVSRGIGPNAIAAESHVQALLVVCHSSMLPGSGEDGSAFLPPGNASEELADRPCVVNTRSMSRADCQRLDHAVERGDSAEVRRSAWQLETWGALKRARELLGHRPAVPLGDVLIEWKARGSLLARWGQAEAGSGYLAGP